MWNKVWKHLIALLIWQSLAATLALAVPQAKPSFPFLEGANSSLARETIAKDFFAEHKEDIRAAEKNIPLGLVGEPRYSAVSNELQKENDALLKKLVALPTNQSANKAVATAINRAQARELIRAIQNHPVVSDLAAEKYDSRDQTIGYCFGRATFVHKELMRRKLHPASIGKIFAVGDLQYRGRSWDFHVATIARSTSGSWWALDGMSPEPLELRDWMQFVKKLSRHPESPYLSFYFANPAKFQPIPGAYSKSRLYDPLYKGYFADLAKWFEQNPAPNKSFTR